jgi:general secretion pathway protein A
MLEVRSVPLFRQNERLHRLLRKEVGIMYNRHFGFLESPFSVTPDPRFFYTNPVYLEAYATLRYGIETKKGFIVITGEVGTGKTTLLRKLLHNLEDTVHSVFIFHTYPSFPELLQFTLHDLGLALKNTSKVTMIQELGDYLIQQHQRGHTVAALIDEAQNLNDAVLEDLRLLSNLETDREKLLQIVLVGQPELEAKLEKPGLRQLKQRVALRCRLDPLKPEEVAAYIDFRLRTAGYEGKGLFHRDAVQQIASYSQGIPRLVNIICDNALLTAYAESKKIVSPNMIKEVARDLRIGSAVQVTKQQPKPALPSPQPERKTTLREVPNRLPERKLRRIVSTGVGTFLGILVLVAAASVIDPQNMLNDGGKSFEVVKQNLNQESVPTKANAEVAPKRKDQRITIQHGATIYKIALHVYNAYTVLGMDLIKEFNPQIEDLNWVSAGQDLLLPSLTRETLLRQQPDGSYRFIVGSFRRQTGAEEYARLLSNKGYQVSITPRRVADDLLLHRVEIDGLKNLEEANQIWHAELRNEWLAFAGNPGEPGWRANKTSR